MKALRAVTGLAGLLALAGSAQAQDKPPADKPLGMHQGVVQAVVFSPDGRLVASAGHEDRTVRVWDVARGKEMRRLLGHTAAVQGVHFSTDGKVLLSTGLQESIRSWDLETGIESRRLDAPGHPFGVAVSPDGKMFATSGQDKEARLWDMETGKIVHVLAGHPLRVWTVAFSPDGKRLATGCEDGNVRIWDVATGRELRSFGGHGFSFCPIAFSSDGTLLASGGADKIIRIWNPVNGQELARFTGTDEILGLAFSPDGRTLASSALNDRMVHLWEVATGKVVRQFEGHQLFAPCVAFAPHGQTVASAGRDGQVRVWDVTGRAKAGVLMPASPSAKELDQLWDALVGDDPAIAYEAGWVLAAAPRQALPLLKKRLRAAPADAALAKRIATLIADLDDNRFAVRDKASTELKRLGARARPALEAALKTKPSEEARRRVELLLEAIPARIVLAEDVPATRGVAVLERIANNEAKTLLKLLAAGKPENFLTRDAAAALRRLAKAPMRMPTVLRDTPSPTEPPTAVTASWRKGIGSGFWVSRLPAHKTGSRIPGVDR